MFWIEVMEALFILNNFESLHQVFMGLRQQLVQQIYSAWKIIDESPPHFDCFYTILKFFEERQNYRNYREYLDRIPTNTPSIPIQSLILRDMTFLEENKTFLPNGHVNLKKMDLLSKVLKAIESRKEAFYSIEEDILVQNILSSRVVLSENELYDLTKDLVQKEKKKIEEQKKQEEQNREKVRNKLEKN